jgi:hypothetical protein
MHYETKSGPYYASAEGDCVISQIKEILVEESNVQPVNSPVTVCG